MFKHLSAHISVGGRVYAVVALLISTRSPLLFFFIYFFFFWIPIPLNQFHLRLWPLLFHLVASCLARQWCVCRLSAETMFQVVSATREQRSKPKTQTPNNELN